MEPSSARPRSNRASSQSSLLSPKCLALAGLVLLDLVPQALLILGHRSMVVGHIAIVSTVPVQRERDPVDREFFDEADPQVLVFMKPQRFVIQSEVNELLDTKHDAAPD